MRNAKRIISSMACALALVANGAAAASAQQQTQRDKQPERDVLVEKDSILITTAQGAGAPPSGIVIGGHGDPSAVSFTFVASEMAFDSRVIKGAPFSAEAVSETTQTLADGNRISHKKTSAIYRDSDGRTRRDEAAPAVGPFATAGEGHKAIFINDPVSATNYILNPNANTATKIAQHFVFERRGPNDAQGGSFAFSMRTEQGRQLDVSKPITAGVLNGRALKGPAPVYPAVARAARADGRVSVEVVVNEEGKVESAKAIDGHPLLRQAAVDAARQWEFAPTRLSGQPVKVTGKITFHFSLPKMEAEEKAIEQTSPSGATMMRVPVNMPRFEETKESLGRQSIEGVEAEGTRTTVTIPAGAIGNERAIQITSERWYSPELQLVVMTRHSDPRFGETTYRLTNINRAEPDRALFEVPAGYTVKEGGPFERHLQTMPMRRPKTEQ